MIVPLTLADFVDRAELVYGEREAIVDEPNPPPGGLGSAASPTAGSPRCAGAWPPRSTS